MTPGTHTGPSLAPSSLTPPRRPPPPPRDDAEALQFNLASIAKHWKLVVALPTAIALVVGAASLARPRVYAAHAAFLASEPSSMNSSLSAVASQFGLSGLTSLASGSGSLSTQFYGDLLTSNALTHAIVTERYDASTPAENGGKPFTGTLVDYIKPAGKTATDNELAAMKSFRTRILAVAVDRPTGIVRFEIKTRNRQLSALIARRMLDLVNDFNLKRRQTQAGAEREFSSRRAKAALDTLRSAEADLASFRSTNIDFSRSPRLATRETELQRRVAIAQQTYTTVAQRYEVANIEAVRNTPVITVLDAPEGLVEARPRHTVGIAMGAFILGFLIACAIALRIEGRRQEPAF